jgi:hypothetical protein
MNDSAGMKLKTVIYSMGKTQRVQENRVPS